MSDFNKVTPEMEKQLASIVGDENCLVGEKIGEDYSHDEMPIYGSRMPEAVVLPASTEEVSAVMRLCDENHVPLTVRGAGTGLAGGAMPLHGGVVLCTMRMDNILGYDMNNLEVRVQAGVRLCDLAKDVEGRGLLYPPDPGEKTSSIGGNVSTNAGGMRAVKYGTTRDYVLAVTAVLPSGEIVHLGRPVTKSSSGYSLMQLVIGSEGTLAIVTEMTLKLIPRPKSSISFILPFDNIESAIASVPKIKMAGLDPRSIEFMERDIVESVAKATGNDIFPDKVDGKEPGAYILVTFDGHDEDEIFSRAEVLAGIGDDMGAYDTLVLDQPSQNKAVWEARDSFLTVIKDEADLVDEMDVVVPTDKIPAFLRFARHAGTKNGVRMRSFGHAGDGNLHIYCCGNDMDQDDFMERSRRVMEACYQECTKLHGEVSGEHGIGYGKKRYLRQSLGDTSIALMHSIKAQFDPNDVLNPGKVCE